MSVSQSRSEKLIGFCIAQAVLLPLLSIAEMVVGVLKPGYDSLSQHLSALGTDGSWSALLVNGAGVAAGLSICVFAIAVLLAGRRAAVSPVLVLIFGISMVSNGVFEMGSPLHGLYGIGMVITIAPLVMAVEYRDRFGAGYERYSLLTAVVSFIYLWMLVTGVDPDAFAGITQRVASLVTYAWFAVTALQWRRTGYSPPVPAIA